MGENSQKTLAMGDIFASSASGSLQMVNSYYNSRARKQAAELKAQQAARKGEDEVRIAGIKTGRLFGAQRAAYAANGLDIAGSVTVRDVLADTAEEGVREAVQIRNNAAAEAQGYRNEAASESPFMDALGAGLSGFATVASKWYTYNKSGVFTPAKDKTGKTTRRSGMGY